MRKRMAPEKTQSNSSSHFNMHEHTRTGQTLCRALFVHHHGPPATSNELLRIPHFSLTEPRLPELVKLAQDHTGKNSKAWIKPDVNASQLQSFFFKKTINHLLNMLDFWIKGISRSLRKLTLLAAWNTIQLRPSAFREEFLDWDI